MAHSFFASLKEALVLLGINWKAKFRNLVEFGRVIMRYYCDISFLKIDTTLLMSYLFCNPFGISKQFLMHKEEKDVYTYGETPLTTLAVIAKSCQLLPQDVVFELGCGRGRTCFWLRHFIGCQVVGVDYVPTFIQKAQQVKEQFHVQGVSFRLEDLFQTDLQGATVIYLYGTCFSDHEIGHLIKRFSQLPEGVKIITVSYALRDIQPKAPFPVLKQFAVPFTWGTADVYLQIKQSKIIDRLK